MSIYTNSNPTHEFNNPISISRMDSPPTHTSMKLNLVIYAYARFTSFFTSHGFLGF